MQECVGGEAHLDLQILQGLVSGDEEGLLPPDPPVPGAAPDALLLADHGVGVGDLLPLGVAVRLGGAEEIPARGETEAHHLLPHMPGPSLYIQALPGVPPQSHLLDFPQTPGCLPRHVSTSLPARPDLSPRPECTWLKSGSCSPSTLASSRSSSASELLTFSSGAASFMTWKGERGEDRDERERVELSLLWELNLHTEWDGAEVTSNIHTHTHTPGGETQTPGLGPRSKDAPTKGCAKQRRQGCLESAWWEKSQEGPWPPLS